ncbi:MAG TPA: serpin family protein [Anaerolineales bacterium]|nr:serpin family protein [Anaerolineales bacterium]
MKSYSYLFKACFLSLVLAIFASSCGQATLPAPGANALPTGSPRPANAATLPPVPAQGNYLQSKLVRITSPNVPEADLAQLARDNNAFAVALYKQLGSVDGNLFLSPYSISLALAMVYGGAAGDTGTQMAQALHFSLPQERLHPAMNALSQKLSSYALGNDPSHGFSLNIANAVWSQQGFQFLPAYLDLLSQDYGAGLHLADFVHAAEASRKAINDWVDQQTHGKITNLFPQGSINAATRLVLANAIYFKATWDSTFDPARTENANFYLADGTTTRVAMMHSRENASYSYARGDGYQAVGLPYAGTPVQMVIIMPDGGKFAGFQSGLNAAQLDTILSGMSGSPLDLAMPKFKIEAVFDLKNTLASLGMPDAFNDKADFSGMDGKKDLYISDILHKAYVNVDENGTEAAAATGVAVGVMAMPAQSQKVTIDHPFLFLLYDPQTNTILFMGRVMNPGG